MHDEDAFDSAVDDEIKEQLAHEALIWGDVLSTPSGREVLMGILRFLGYGQAAFDLNERKGIASTALKDAADALLARAMTHDREHTIEMLKEFY